MSTPFSSSPTSRRTVRKPRPHAARAAADPPGALVVETERTSRATSAERVAIARELHSVAIQLLRRLRVADAASGVSPARLTVLSVLVFRGQQTVGELAANELVRPPTMTRLVQGLAADGLVDTAIDPDDRRVVRVSATPRGRELLLEGRDQRVAVLVELLGGLPDGDLATLTRASELLRSALQVSERVSER